MADARLFCVTIAVCLIAASTAKPKSAQVNDVITDDTKAAQKVASNDANEARKDTTELKELLIAMKRYLHAKEELDRSSRAIAYEDERTVYDPASSADEVAQLETSKNGSWTDWIEVDPANNGFGEFEECDRIHDWQDSHRKCLVPCEKPLAVRYTQAQETKATWADIENCVGPLSSVTSCGVKCYNKDAYWADKTNCQKKQCKAFGVGADCTDCPQVRVKFFCEGQRLSDADKDTCCQYASSCARGIYVSLRTALAKYRTADEKRDVLVNVLYEVQDAMQLVD